ncbi:MAG: hypothetical protein HY329_17115 [Chloroflexi bacterium]|nr:hypothetical protein [Chloroflexota bacterium]
MDHQIRVIREREQAMAAKWLMVGGRVLVGMLVIGIYACTAAALWSSVSGILFAAVDPNAWLALL